MKIINKSGNEECSSEKSFYVVLSADAGDRWEEDYFECTEADKYSTEELAVAETLPGMSVAKVTIVAKII